MRFFIAYMLAIGFYLGTATVHAQTTQPSIVSVGIQYSDATKIVTMHPTVLEAVRIAMEKAFPATQPSTKPTTGPAPIKLKNADVKNYVLRGTPEQPLKVVCPDVWAKPRHAGPTGSADDGPPEREGSLRCVGGVNTFENLILTGGDGGILLGSSRDGMPDIYMRNVLSEDGVALGRFQGGHKLTIIDSGAKVASWAYPFACMTAQWDEILVDRSGVPRSSPYFWFHQGGRFLNNKKNGEAVIRIHWGHYARFVNINCLPYYPFVNAGGWKPLVQDRSGGPASDTTSVHEWFGCEIAYDTEIGWMASGPDAGKGDHCLGLSRWTNCKFEHEPRINRGVLKVEYVNCQIGHYDATHDIWINLKPLNKQIAGRL